MLLSSVYHYLLLLYIIIFHFVSNLLYKKDKQAASYISLCQITDIDKQIQL
jgi:hypothetical protein